MQANMAEATPILAAPKHKGRVMLHLVEISLLRSEAVDATRQVEPLACDDLRACAKTWMAIHEEVACRPWACIEAPGGNLRLVGWRSAPPAPQITGSAAYVAHRSFGLSQGQSLTLQGEFAAIRRHGHVAYDAARGRLDKNAAYTAWLAERLIDLQAHAKLLGITIIAHVPTSGLRKARGKTGRSKRLAEVRFPAVRAEVELRVGDPAGVEAWLLAGTGPHKAFGFGCFVPSAGAAL
jgi:hypothetical protein